MRSIKDDLILRRLDGARTNAPQCTTGKLCGDRCIPRNSECHSSALGESRSSIKEHFNTLTPLQKKLIVGAGVASVVGATGATAMVRNTAKKAVMKPIHGAAREVLGSESVSKTSEHAGYRAVRGAQKAIKTSMRHTYKQGVVNHTRAVRNLESNVNAPLKELHRAIGPAMTGGYETMRRLEPKGVKNFKRQILGITDSIQVKRKLHKDANQQASWYKPPTYKPNKQSASPRGPIGVVGVGAGGSSVRNPGRKVQLSQPKGIAVKNPGMAPPPPLPPQNNNPNPQPFKPPQQPLS